MDSSRTPRGRRWQDHRDGSSSVRRPSAVLGGEPLEQRLALAGESLAPSAAVPGPPLDVRVVGGDAIVAVSWTAPASDGGAAITDYVVEYSRDGSGSWSPYDDGISAATSATVTGLWGGAAYLFRVAAVNGTGTGAASAPSVPVSPRTVPGLPLNVAAVAVVPVAGPSGVAAPSRVSVTWNPPASDGGYPITGYAVECSQDAGLTWQRIPQDQPGARPSVVYAGTSATVSGLPTGVSHVFRVTATNFAGNGLASANSAPAVPFSTPSAPTGVFGWVSASKVNVVWTPPTANGGAPITDYKVEYRRVTDPTWTTFNDGTSASATVTVTGLVDGEAYVFRVAAVNRAGAGASSSESQAVTPRAVPGMPGAVSAQFGDRQVALSWTAPADAGSLPITRYLVQYLSRGRWIEYRGRTPVPAGQPPATSVTITGLTNGVVYSFRVAAVNEAGAGRPAWVQNVTPRTIPGACGLLAARALPGAVQLTWRPLSNGGSAILGYAVDYSGDGGRTWTKASPAGADAQPRAVISGLTNGRPYVFRVAAINAVGTGVPSPISAPVIPRALPGAPTNVVATARGAMVTLVWQPPASDGGAAIKNYVAWYSIDGGTTWSQLETRESAAPTTSVFGLERYRDLSYVFRVAAVNDAGLGGFSAASAPLRFAVL